MLQMETFISARFHDGKEHRKSKGVLLEKIITSVISGREPRNGDMHGKGKQLMFGNQKDFPGCDWS
jgi:hypothetical protein